MIFVAIGTTDFDDLLRAVDDLCPAWSEPVIMQIGRSAFIPRHAEHFRFAPSLTPYYEQASLVISHGGLGIVTEVMQLGRPLVAVEDPSQPDRHQREILEVWAQAGHLVWCQALTQLPEAIEQARQCAFTPYRPPESRIHLVIAEHLRQWV